jgi:hypothetical protein
MTRSTLYEERNSLEKLWQQGMPRAAVLLECEVQLKGGHCAGVTLDGPYPSAHVVILEVDEQSAPPATRVEHCVTECVPTASREHELRKGLLT